MNNTSQQQQQTFTGRTISKITPENASQLLATMQPQPPSFITVTQKAPIQATNYVTTKAQQPLQNSNQYVSQQLQQQPSNSLVATPATNYIVATPSTAAKNNSASVMGSAYYQDNNSSSQNIRLPTVPVPTSSVYSSGMSPVISQQTAAAAVAVSNTQNYLFATTMPQQVSSSSPSSSAFNMSVGHAKTTSNNAAVSHINRNPVTNTGNVDMFQFLNIPK